MTINFSLDKETHRYVITIIGYSGLACLCFRLIPPILVNIYYKKRINIAGSFLVLELIACVCYIIYANYHDIVIMWLSNAIILANVIIVLIYNYLYYPAYLQKSARIAPNSINN